MTEKLYLICDCMGWGANGGTLVESKKVDSNGRVTFYGPFTETDRVNKNNRIYPDKVLRPEFDRLAEYAKTGRLFGEVDHPQDSVIHLKDVGFAITNLWWDNSKKTVGWGEAKTLNTPMGWILEGILQEGWPVGISSRGLGTGNMSNEGQLIIAEGFRLVTFDGVGDPSYQDGWQMVKENVMAKIKKGRVSVYMNTASGRAAFNESGISRGGLTGIESGKSLPVVRDRIEDNLDALPVVGTLESVCGVKATEEKPAASEKPKKKLDLGKLMEATSIIAASRIRKED